MITADLGLAGDSAGIAAVRAQIRRLAPIPAPVLVRGETGTGKELVARALHRESGRSGPFVAVNAAAIPATLAASEIFGHVRGAFTGATHDHRGVFQQAHGGTLFLDEVADLPLDLQASLLRVLETGELRPVGSERSRVVDVRVIAATHADVHAAADRGAFRSDLRWRLAVLEIDVPPLRDRKSDLPALVAKLLGELGLDRTLSASAIDVLASHAWPGNVRELRAVLIRAAAASETCIDAAEVVDALGHGRVVHGVGLDAVVAATGSVAAAARRLGIPRSTLRSRLRAA